MLRLDVKVLQFWTLVLFFSSIRADKIDWEYEVSKSDHLFRVDYDGGRIHKLVQDIMAPGFVLIAPDFAIQADFKALEKWITEMEDNGRFIGGQPHFVATCDNTAVVWRNVTYYEKGCCRKNGTAVILFEYINDTLKTKFFQSTI